MPDIVLLKREVAAMQEVVCEFWVKYQTILDTAASLSEKRGRHYDTTPLHHRFSAAGLVHEILKKGKRLEAVVGTAGWNNDPDLVKAVVREAPDVVNYAAFLGAFALQLLADLEVTQEDVDQALDPELGESSRSMLDRYGRGNAGAST